MANLSEGWAVIQNLRILAIALAITFAPLLVCGTIALSQDRKTSGAPAKRQADSGPAQQSFATNCAGCHGLDGKGGERAPDIVTRPDIRRLSDSELFQILQMGVTRKSMPAFSYLGDPALHSIVTYLRTLQGNPLEATLPGNAKRGLELFFGKGECSRCHMVRGEGGFFASDLSGYSRGRSPDLVRDAIVSPNRNLDPRNRTVAITLPNGKKLEGIARNEDNFSIQLLAQDGVLYLLNKSELTTLAYRDESPMPADYGTRLSAAELDDLVNYLSFVGLKGKKTSENHEELYED